jgi:hypothetical protein
VALCHKEDECPWFRVSFLVNFKLRYCTLLISNLGTAHCTALITGKTKNGKESGMKD